MITVCTNPWFPVSLLGSVHLKSFIDILDRDLMDKWLRDPELNACSLRGSYFGMYASARKGSEYVLLLELVHRGSQKLIWREYVVLYSAQNAKL